METRYINEDVLLFFDEHSKALALYEMLMERAFKLFPDTAIRASKTQISLKNKHIYGCISFLRIKKKKELSDDYFILTLRLPFPLETQRTIIITEPYPGRYTNHILISDISDLDDELFSWIALAYDFSNSK